MYFLKFSIAHQKTDQGNIIFGNIFDKALEKALISALTDMTKVLTHIHM
jgi:hypothetical protein